MHFVLADKRGKIVGSEERYPVCGEDFCDSCGDCLYCYWNDPCPESGAHFPVRYVVEGE